MRNINLTTRYLFALGLIATVALAVFAALQWVSSAQTEAIVSLEQSGHQQQLLHQMTQSAFRLLVQTDPALGAGELETLASVVSEFEATHIELVSQSTRETLRSKGAFILLPSSTELATLYLDAPVNLDAKVQNYIQVVRRISSAGDVLNVDRRDIGYVTGEGGRGLATALTVAADRHQEQAMALTQLATQVRIASFLLVLLTLVFCGLLLFRPLGAQIQHNQELLQAENAQLAVQNKALIEQTRALEISSLVSRHLSAIIDKQQLITEVVTQIGTTFNFYHTHIYLLDEQENQLKLVAGTGVVGQQLLARGHAIALGKGMVGMAAVSRRTIFASDVSQEPAWQPNELLPETKAEITVPIMLGKELMGVLDVQENQINGLTQDDVYTLELLANQTAVALRNANTYTQAQERARREAVINDISQKIQAADTIEQTLKVASQEIGRIFGAERASVHIGLYSSGTKESDEL